MFLTISVILYWLIAGIPQSLQSAIAAGIGMFLAIIAFSTAGIVVHDDATIVGLGDLTEPAALYAIFGFFIIATLGALKVRGAILLGILSVTIASILLGHNEFHGIVSAPPSLAPTLFQMDIVEVFQTGFVHVILVLVLVEVLDRKSVV